MNHIRISMNYADRSENIGSLGSLSSDLFAYLLVPILLQGIFLRFLVNCHFLSWKLILLCLNLHLPFSPNESCLKILCGVSYYDSVHSGFISCVPFPSEFFIRSVFPSLVFAVQLDCLSQMYFSVQRLHTVLLSQHAATKMSVI